MGDAEELFAIRGDREAMRYWDWPLDQTLGETREAAAIFEGQMKAGQALYFTARLAHGAFVGLFDLSELDQARADLGFMVARPLWGHGYGYEGAQAMLAEARRRRLDGLKARIHAGNAASRRLLQKLDFRSLGPAQPVEVVPGRVVECETLALDL
jgi:RimJ/RimL family protein N-acetyltransferase